MLLTLKRLNLFKEILEKIFKDILAYEHCWCVSEDKLEDACDFCEYRDDARGIMKTHNTSFHSY